MVVEPACFLPSHQRCQKINPIFTQRRKLRDISLNHLNIGIEPLSCAELSIIAQQNRTVLKHFIEGVYDVVLRALHTGSRDLHNENIEETVDNQAWKTIRVAVDQAVA